MIKSKPVISCKNVWKLFGFAPEKYYKSLSKNKSYEDIQADGYIAGVKDVSVDVFKGEMLVIMGLSGSGKSTLLRCMSRLHAITGGTIAIDDQDIMSLEEKELIDLRRNKMGMVFQSFGLLPHRSVLENVAFPLEMRGQSKHDRRDRALEVIKLVGLEGREDYFPRELSGGQQQRTAMARALVKDAEIILFDEPLVNLDYKLREELRQEMRELFQTRHTIAIYATTEPNEALALGGTTTILHEGCIVQSGKTAEVYRKPNTVSSATLFSEPPINLLSGKVTNSEVCFDEKAHFPLNQSLKHLGQGEYIFGIRPSHLSLLPKNDDDIELSVQVEVAEISGSETFLHVCNNLFEMVLHLPGVHSYDVDESIKIYIPIHKFYVFGMDEQLIHAPSQHLLG